MELDKRIINGKRPLTCFDTEEAEKYIGKLCYMCDEYDQFYKLNLIEPTILKGVEDCEIPFHYGRDYQAEFCLPCDWVTKEKQYRPYTLMEFQSKFTIGLPIKFRKKGEVGNEMYLILNGYVQKQLKDKTITCIYIGTYTNTLDELFNAYEWFDKDSNTWELFGVEE